MIELRWQLRDMPKPDGDPHNSRFTVLVRSEDGWDEKEKVLQFRTGIDPMTIGIIGEIVWSEWQDVPTFIEIEWQDVPEEE